MFAFAHRFRADRRPLAEPGLSAEQYERIAARLRQQRATYSLAPNLGAATQPTFRLIAITTRGGTP